MLNLKPILTEKTLAQSKLGRYTFKVPLKTSVGQALKAVEAVFGVKVKSISSLRRAGERKRSRNHYQLRRGEKLVTATLKEGRIDFFETPQKETKVKETKGKKK